MDMQTLKERIESLDPRTHKALKDALTAEYDRLTRKKGEAKPQSEPAPDTFTGIGSLPDGYRLKYPDAQATSEELEEIVQRVHSEGYVLLWSNVLRDLVAFYRDEEARSNIPPGFVPYSEAEIEELWGEGKTPHALRLIHEAKRYGARVLGLGDCNEPNAEG